MSPVPAAALLAALAAAALLADRTISVAIIAAGLFALCLRAPRGRRWPYLIGTLGSGLVLFLLSPLVARYGGVVYWEGPEVPVIGQLDVTSEELAEALFQSLRLVAVGLAFAAYALLLDLDGLLLAGGRLRRSVLAVARSKLRSGLPGHVRIELDLVAERFLLDAEAWFRPTLPTPTPR